MASFLTYLGQAASLVSAIRGILGGGTDCVMILSGDGAKVNFPVLPGEFDVTNKYQNSRLSINSLGEINMKGKRGLQTLKFSSFFPANDYGWLGGGGILGNINNLSSAADPYGNVAKIKQIAESNQPAMIAISGTDISMPCLIDDFTYKEQDGSGDVYFSLELSEYRYIGPESQVTNSATGLKGRIAKATGTRSTTVTAGMDSMDAACKAVSRTTSIVKQARRKLGVYRSIVKSGGIRPGNVIHTAASIIKAGNNEIKF